MGHVEVYEPETLGYVGGCGYNDDQVQMSTIHGDVGITCEVNEQMAGVSIETSVITWTDTQGVGTANVFVRGAGALDCDITLDVEIAKQ